MKAFYKIVDGYPQVGQGVEIPDGFMEYEIGKEPTELLDAITNFTSIEEATNKINEANKYLKDTDWVEIYKLRHDTELEIIPVSSSKWEILAKREETKTFLRNI